MRAAFAACLLLAACGPHARVGTPAAECGACHLEQHAQWQTSRHAQSGASPVLAALLPRVEAAWGSVARARCQACHTPQLEPGEDIGCVACHSAVGNRREADGALVVDLDAPLAAPAPAPGAPHPTEVRGLLRSASLCGTCHEVHGPGLLFETTLTEFRDAGAADGACAGCHQPGGESHAFAGVDPAWGADAGVAAQANGAAAALWGRALELDASNQGAQLSVGLSNAGAAHAVPTGVAVLRDVWVEVRFSPVAPDPVRVLELGAQLTRGGQPVAVLTDADLVTSRGLSPGERRAVSVPVPPGTTSVEVTLKARAVSAAALEALGLAARASEVPELSVKQVELAWR